MAHLILLAEDDIYLSELLKEALETRGYKVVQAFNGLEASEKAFSLRPSLLLLDVQMPEIYGSAVYAAVKKQEPANKVPVIFLSGLHRDTLDIILPTGPNIRALSKPVDFSRLEAAIRELLPDNSREN